MRTTRPRPSMMRFTPAVLALAAAFFLFASCGDPSGPGTPAELWAVGQVELTGTAGSTLSDPVVVELSDENGEPSEGLEVHWSASGGALGESPPTSQSSVAGTMAASAGSSQTSTASQISTVTDADGRARVYWTLDPRVGTYSLTAALDGLNAVEFTVTVRAGAPAEVTLSGSTLSFSALGETEALSIAGVADEQGNEIPEPSVTWASSDETVATVDDGGMVTAAGTGSAEVTASVGGATADASVEVTQDVALVAATPDRIELASGGTAQLEAHVEDANGYAIPSADITWTSGDPRVAAVDAAGLLTAEEAGTVEITVTCGDLSASIEVTVTPGAVRYAKRHAGDGQTAVAGEDVETPPAARVTDAAGNPVSGVRVRFTIAGGGGSVPTDDHYVRTGADGVAAVGRWTLGTGAGENALNAKVDGRPVLTFTATGEVGPASQLSKEAGDGQTATVGTEVTENPTVGVTDAHGNPVSGVEVDLAVKTGGGSLASATVTTDASGIAAVEWTLGTTPGTNELDASISGVGTVTFTATATAGAAGAISMHAGDAQSATVDTKVATDPAVLVEDADGNPVSGVEVDFAVTTGGGSVAPATVTTDASGIAAVEWTLGTTPGTNELDASISGVGTVTFTATATAGAAAQLAFTTQPTNVGATLTMTPAVEVEVRDSHGNPVTSSMASVVLAIGTNPSGGTLSGTATAAAVNGVATFSDLSIDEVGTGYTFSASSGAITSATSTSFDVTHVIAFESERDGNYEIYVVDTEGRQQANLTNNAAFDRAPDWSPDGSQIAFSSSRDGNYEIYVGDADGSGQTRLTNTSAADLQSVWSPDGSRIAFRNHSSGSWDIYVMNADGSGRRRLTNQPGVDSNHVWSPDGSQIAVQRHRQGFWEIFVVNVDGSGQTNITNDPGVDEAPVWSPDGSQIAFGTNRDGNHEIYVMGADGSGLTRLTNNAAGDRDPVWSPDGSQIAFRSNRDGNWEIYVMDADGSGQTRLTSQPRADESPVWSPDGSQIAFVSNRDGNSEIYVMNADGSGQTNLTNNAASDSGPVWRPHP